MRITIQNIYGDVRDEYGIWYFFFFLFWNSSLLSLSRYAKTLVRYGALWAPTIGLQKPDGYRLRDTK